MLKSLRAVAFAAQVELVEPLKSLRSVALVLSFDFDVLRPGCRWAAGEGGEGGEGAVAVSVVFVGENKRFRRV